MFKTEFLRDTAERAVATFAQALAAILVAGGFGLLDADWIGSLSAAGMAALLAVLKAVGAFAYDHDTGASFGTAIPKGEVAAVEAETYTGYAAEEAAAGIPEGDPVRVYPTKHYDKD